MSTSNNIGLAVIGFGNIAKTHISSIYNANLFLSLNQPLNLKYIYTRSEKNVPHGIINTQSLKTVMEDTSIHIVDICTVNSHHLEVVELAAKYGKSIYCEKPITSTLKDSKLALDVVNKHNVSHAVALVYRFAPAIQLFKQLICEQRIGNIIRFKTVMLHKSYLDPARKGKWRTLSSSGGGALLDLGVHLIDMVQFTLGNIHSVNATSDIHFKDRSEVDEITNCRFKLENGILGELEVSRIYGEMKQRTELVVYGELGSITFDSEDLMHLKIYDFASDTETKISCKTYPKTTSFYAFQGGFSDVHGATIAAFTEELSSGIKNASLARFSDAVSAQRVVEASYASAISEKTIIIDTIEF